MEFDRGFIIFFECDQRGRRTRCTNGCGKKNSKGRYERPFLVLSLKYWNNNIQNDGMFALPITTQQGNAYSIDIDNDMLADTRIKHFNGSKVLCDKLCRISELDLPPLAAGEVVHKVKVAPSALNIIMRKTEEALVHSGVLIHKLENTV
jgi:hypothetical protein